MGFSDNARAARAAKHESDKKYDEKRKDWRARAWTCVVYPESAPEDWMDALHALRVAYFVSPLHDRDLNAEGEPKKPHYHVVLDAGSGQLFSGDQAAEMFAAFGGVYPDPAKNRNEFLKQCKVRKLVNALRYLCHLDEHDPYKVKYDVADVRCGYNELPYNDMVLREVEKDDLTMQMCDYALEHGVTDWATFVVFVKREHPEWMHELIHGAGGRFVSRFINGLLTQAREEREKKKYLMTKWRYEKETKLPTPESVLDENLRQI